MFYVLLGVKEDYKKEVFVNIPTESAHGYKDILEGIKRGWEKYRFNHIGQ